MSSSLTGSAITQTRSHLINEFREAFAFVAPGFPPVCGGPDDLCREARHLSFSHPGCVYGTRFGLAASEPSESSLSALCLLICLLVSSFQFSPLAPNLPFLLSRFIFQGILFAKWRLAHPPVARSAIGYSSTRTSLGRCMDTIGSLTNMFRSRAKSSSILKADATAASIFL